MKLTEEKIKTALAPISSALVNINRASRENLFDRFMDEPYGDEVKGRSQYRATDVADVVEAVFAEAMEVFTRDDHLVEFAPVGPEDEPAARQETDLVHHLFREKNNSFTTLSTWFKEGLIEQNAYVRCGWIEKERVLIEEYDDLTLAEFMAVYNQIVTREGDYEVERLEGFANSQALIDGTESKPVPEIDEATGQPKTIDVRIRCVKTEKVYEIEPIPQNEFFISPRWAKISLDGCPVCGHKGKKSKSELLALGFSEESIEKLSDGEDSSGESNRHATADNDDGLSYDDDRLEICEAYVLAEVDDNGKDRLLKVWTNGDGTVVLKWKSGELAIEEVEAAPFVGWTPYLVPHRHVGRSVAELAAPIQFLKTVLWRQTLDNMYSTNYQRPEVVEELASGNTYEDLASPAPGRPIRVQGQGCITWKKPPTILGETLPLMDRADQELEKHAGASRYAQGLDPNALSKSQIGSEGVGRIMDAAMRRMQVIIRTFAETGLREVFLKMHADMRRGPARNLALKIRGQWVETNPLEWRDRTDMTVRIGTGKGDREKRITALQWVLGQQKEMIAQGAINVSPAHIYETQKRIVRAMGLQSVDPYISDPNTIEAPQPQPPQPDPAIEAQMALAQAEQMKAQAAMVKAQTDQSEAQARINFKAQELQLEREIADFRAQEAAAQLEIKRTELQIKQTDVAIKKVKAINEIENDAEDRDAAAFGGAGQ
jgi:hypothetical protein